MSGERVEINDDGLTAYTDNPVPIWTNDTCQGALPCTNGTYVFVVESGITKIDAATGIEVGTITSVGTDPEINITATSTHVFQTGDTGTDLRKYDIATGAQVVTGGWPKTTGDYNDLTNDGTYLYVIDSGDIHKFNVSDGASVTGSGFPISASISNPCVMDGFLYGKDYSTNHLRKFNLSTGAEVVTGGWPVNPFAGDPIAGIAAGNGAVFATEDASLGGDGNIHKFDAATGAEITTDGWPVVGGSYYDLAADDNRLYAASLDANGAVTYNSFNIVADYGATHIDSDTGEVYTYEVDAAIVRSRGPLLVQGRSHDRHWQTRWTRSSNQSIPGGGFHDITYSSTSSIGDGYGRFWTQSGGTIYILKNGTYAVSGDLEWASNTTGWRQLSFLVNGGFVVGQMQWPAGIIRQSASDIFCIAAGGYLVLQASQSITGGGALNVAAAHLRITRLGTY